jgi:uncharacterized CHY-type Zn-finger protein
MNGRCPTCLTNLSFSEFKEQIKCPVCKDVFNIEHALKSKTVKTKRVDDK